MTTPEAELQLPTELDFLGQRAWGYMIRRLELPWFHLTMSAGARRQVLFFNHPRQWLHLVKGEDDFRIIHVQLVSPGWLNGSDDWRMESLTQAWTGSDPENGRTVGIYVVKGGARYLDSQFGPKEAQLIGVTKVFDAANLMPETHGGSRR